MFRLIAAERERAASLQVSLPAHDGFFLHANFTHISPLLLLTLNDDDNNDEFNTLLVAVLRGHCVDDGAQLHSA